jgi:hypothetical protein
MMALVHYPVYNRRREVVATAITNLDIHDIARACCAYGVDGVLIVNPLERQMWLLDRILQHWKTGFGADAHPNRREALKIVHSVADLEEAVAWVEEKYKKTPITIATSALARPGAVDYPALKEILMERDGPALLLLGTGWGLSDAVIEGAGYVLRPIMAHAPYNHLSVRSAAAVILDRLFGDRLTDCIEDKKGR